MSLRYLHNTEERLHAWWEQLATSTFPRDQEAAVMMQDLVARLAAHPLANACWVWADVSRSVRLVPRPHVGAAVSIHVIGSGIYEITYPLPPDDAPWEAARVVGQTCYLDELIPMIEAAWERRCAMYGAEEGRKAMNGDFVV